MIIVDDSMDDGIVLCCLLFSDPFRRLIRWSYSFCSDEPLDVGPLVDCEKC